jgi:hypothetical protein
MCGRYRLSERKQLVEVHCRRILREKSPSIKRTPEHVALHVTCIRASNDRSRLIKTLQPDRVSHVVRKSCEFVRTKTLSLAAELVRPSTPAQSQLE